MADLYSILPNWNIYENSQQVDETKPNSSVWTNGAYITADNLNHIEEGLSKTNQTALWCLGMLEKIITIDDTAGILNIKYQYTPPY